MGPARVTFDQDLAAIAIRGAVFCMRMNQIIRTVLYLRDTRMPSPGTLAALHT
jgi:hypothetical protein